MTRPRPLLLLAVLVPVALLGFLLWRGNGLDIWLQQAIRWCF